MSAAITFSLDLEDHRARRDGPARYTEITLNVLDLLEQWAVRGTFFVVGEVAEDAPQLIRAIARGGHEIAFHSFYHRPLTSETPARFLDETRRGKALLEDLSGQAVTGYRAPIFSVTPRSRWCIDVLHDLEFQYSSSVLPLSNPLYGYPGLPATPFRWPGGLLEIPVPTARLGPFRFPYLGGFYLRYLPRRLVAWLRTRAPAAQRPWIYCHPYDFDKKESFCRMRDASLPVSVLLWLNRAATQAKLEAVLEGGAAPPFAEQIERGDFARTQALDCVP